MRIFLILVTLTGCGRCNNNPGAPIVDTAIDTPIDMPPPALNCSTYCDEIQTHCAGPNAQYPNLDQCTHACASFSVGTSQVTDTAGNTLGCRINYAIAASMMAAVHCPQAGPAGDLITASTPGFCSGGDLCTSFCNLDLLACGSKDTPLPNDPKDSFGVSLYQYVNLADCMRLCPAWDKTHVYSTTSMGDSLACRLSTATTAAISIDSAKVYCAYTADAPTGRCAGAASP
jgi:hypothetical protein